MSTRAPVAITRGHAKCFVNDISTLPEVLKHIHLLDKPADSLSTVGRLAALATSILEAGSLAFTDKRIRSVRDVIFQSKARLSDKQLKFLRMFNDCYSFLRHISESDMQREVEDIVSLLASASWADADPDSTLDSDSGSDNLSMGETVDSYKHTVFTPTWTMAGPSSTSVGAGGALVSDYYDISDVKEGGVQAAPAVSDSSMQTEHLTKHDAITMTEKDEQSTQYENDIGTLNDHVTRYKQQIQTLQTQVDEMNKQSFDSERTWSSKLQVMSELMSSLHARISVYEANSISKDKKKKKR
eukprot:TRINITY_DN111500_c0_g1_i1.p1 TRINITY_DN111500_c0_g1~~TRINITY_DN111500_c0_g1_i1.p1  ORF type:complete len:316 (-),score=53.06 TRINITY_DN111500_c0_g1_i1:149-1045(-)